VNTALNGQVNWPVRELGEVIELFDHKRVPLNSRERQDRQGPYPYYGAQGVIDHIDDFLFDGRYILVAEDGENLNSKKLPLALFANGKFWVNNHAHILRGKSEVADDSFLLACLNNADIRPYVTGAAQPKLSQANLRQIEIPFPPFPIQRRIAGILSAYDELIENNQQRIRILEEMARMLYREWFVNFRFPGHEKVPLVDSPLGPIPKGWKIVPFTEIADVLSGGTPKTDVPEYWSGDIPFFTPRDAPDCFYVPGTDKHISELGLSKCASELYPPDTVFITARGTVGTVALAAVPMAMNQSCYALRAKAPFPQRFLFLMTLQQVDYFKKNTGGATFDTIIVDTFHRMQVARPDCDAVVELTARIDAVFDQIKNLQRQTINLRRTRDLLLPRLLAGDVAVSIPCI
jgi:type I restriction enzyme S subunit